MTTTPTLRVDRLGLRNFRCFAECTVELHPQLTVLVAENSRGKTAVLDAIRIALGLFVDTVSGTRQYADFDRMDVRLIYGEGRTMIPVLPTEFVADGYVAGQAIHWSRSLKSYGLRARTTTREAESLRQAAQQLRESIEDDATEGTNNPPILPLVAFYGTGRLWSEHRLTERKRTNVGATNERLSGYIDCLSSSSSFKGAVAWYENKINETRDPRFSTELSMNLRLLGAVKEATQVVLEPTGWCELEWDFEQKSLVVGHPEYGRLPLSALSDGVRNMIALIADIAQRCASLNPHFGEAAARQTPGVLLIDEVDMHLHPRWQQVVLHSLQKAFPLMQFIVTTHSPQVLTTLRKEEIRILVYDEDGNWTAREPATSPLAHESGDALAYIMGTHPRPDIPNILADLHAYEQLARSGRGDSEEARQMKERLDTAGFEFSHAEQALFDFLTRKATNPEANNR